MASPTIATFISKSYESVIARIIDCFTTSNFIVSSFIEYLPFRSQDLTRNSLYCLPYNSYDVSSENLVLNQLIIP